MQQKIKFFILFVMIVVISSTNRPDSRTEKLTRRIQERLELRTAEPVRFFDLAHLPYSILHAEMYDEGGQSDEVRSLHREYFEEADRFIFIIPEYNGGVPGILKLWIDAMSVRNLKMTFEGKKACLIGLSSGRAGNLRGMENFTGILNYLDVVVFPEKLPISQIHEVMNGAGRVDTSTEAAIDQLLERFLNF